MGEGLGKVTWEEFQEQDDTRHSEQGPPEKLRSCPEGLGTASWCSFLLAELIVVCECVLWPGLT